MKWVLGITGGLTFVLVLFWLGLGFFPNPLTREGDWNWTVKITDRHGRHLKDFLPPKIARRQARPLSDFSPHLVAAILTAEDKRFNYHLGVDPLAVLRAAWLNYKHEHIVSGASTITMQLARLSQGLSPGPRTYGRKIKEMWWALLIERHNSKETILSEYLNLIPCGNLTEGFAAAARLYLGKSVSQLSAAEAAFLAGLPASPGALNPYKDPRPALARRTKILLKMEVLGYLDPDSLGRALEEPLALDQLHSSFNAPHFVNYLRNNFTPLPPPLITTTLDLDLQEQVEELVRTTVADYEDLGLSQIAVVILSVPEREVLAWVGSSDFWGVRDGQNDGVLALRQPGSALKPFLYATAFDRGVITAATLMADGAVDYQTPQGNFSPSNYSDAFYGQVSARLALGSSLNLPAVKLAARTGIPELLEGLQELGLNSLDRGAEHYGLSLALGGGEVNLLSLVTAYAALADGGYWQDRRVILDPAPNFLETTTSPKAVFSPAAAFLVTDILADPQARITGFGSRSVLNTPYPTAVKTGTSKSFRDNWCVGYTSNYVVGVWAGNFQASPMDQVSGITGAGTVWRQVSDLMYKRQVTTPFPFKAPEELRSHLTCPESGLLAGKRCPNRQLEYFLEHQPRPASCSHAETQSSATEATIPVLGLNLDFHLIRPLNHTTYALDPGIAPEIQNIKALGQSVPGVELLEWRLNGEIIKREAVEGFTRSSCLLPLTLGESEVELWGLNHGEARHKAKVIYRVF